MLSIAIAENPVIDVQLVTGTHLDIRLRELALHYDTSLANTNVYKIFVESCDNATVVFFDEDMISVSWGALQKSFGAITVVLEREGTESMFITEDTSWTQLHDFDKVTVHSATGMLLCMQYKFMI